MTDNKLLKALDTIAKGMTNEFPGAPDIMSETPDSFRYKMWQWSQACARAAVEEHERSAPCETCGGSGAVDAPFSGSDPSCPACDGEGVAAE